MSPVFFTAFFITTWEAHPDSHLTSNLEVVMYTTGDSDMIVNRIQYHESLLEQSAQGL